jgi:hypothetical protein
MMKAVAFLFALCATSALAAFSCPECLSSAPTGPEDWSSAENGCMNMNNVDDTAVYIANIDGCDCCKITDVSDGALLRIKGDHGHLEFFADDDFHGMEAAHHEPTKMWAIDGSFQSLGDISFAGDLMAENIGAGMWEPSWSFAGSDSGVIGSSVCFFQFINPTVTLTCDLRISSLTTSGTSIQLSSDIGLPKVTEDFMASTSFAGQVTVYGGAVTMTGAGSSGQNLEVSFSGDSWGSDLHIGLHIQYSMTSILPVSATYPSGSPSMSPTLTT